jgi:hypothetical protein
VGLVDEQDGEDALTGELFDVSRDGEEDVAGGGAVGNAERMTEVPWRRARR